jgi:uncharacterized protein YkwD
VGLLPRVGGRALFGGDVTFLSLGQAEESWDEVVSVEYDDRAALWVMSTCEEWREAAVHRQAGLAGQLDIETTYGAGFGPGHFTGRPQAERSATLASMFRTLAKQWAPLGFVLWSLGCGSSPGAPLTVAPVAHESGGAPATETAVPASMGGLLEAHNRYRALHCAEPLTWSPEVAAAARAWAEELRRRGCALQHSDNDYGENIALGSAGVLDAETAVAMWYGEIEDYDWSEPGFRSETGHFTQVVWLATRSLGCATARCGDLVVWVCNYDPPGNWRGHYPSQVKTLDCR